MKSKNLFIYSIFILNIIFFTSCSEDEAIPEVTSLEEHETLKKRISVQAKNLEKTFKTESSRRDFFLKHTTVEGPGPGPINVGGGSLITSQYDFSDPNYPSLAISREDLLDGPHNISLPEEWSQEGKKFFLAYVNALANAYDDEVLDVIQNFENKLTITILPTELKNGFDLILHASREGYLSQVTAEINTQSLRYSKGSGFWGCMAGQGKTIARGIAWGAISGAIRGGIVGAAGGTVAAPGIGTATGAVGGAVFGAFAGALWGAAGGTVWAAANCLPSRENVQSVMDSLEYYNDRGVRAPEVLWRIALSNGAAEILFLQEVEKTITFKDPTLLSFTPIGLP